MSRQTHYFVQTFDAVTGDQLKAGAPIACRTAESALRTAERLALSKTAALSKTGALSKGGVVAFATTSDADTGDYDDQPTVLFRAGNLPAEFDLMP